MPLSLAISAQCPEEAARADNAAHAERMRFEMSEENPKEPHNGEGGPTPFQPTESLPTQAAFGYGQPGVAPLPPDTMPTTTARTSRSAWRTCMVR